MMQPAVQNALDGGLTTRGNHLCTWPTGVGKTHTSREAACEEAQRGLSSIVLVPLKALAAEVKVDWQAALPHLKVEAYTSDSVRPKRYAQADVRIMTPERLEMVLRQWRRHTRWLATLGLVVVDEIHLLDDPSRGGRLDGTLTKLRLLCPLTRLIGLSATVGDAPTLAAWMDAHWWGGGERPVPLRWHVHHVGGAKGKMQWLSANISAGTNIFVHSRKRAEELAHSLTTDSFKVGVHHAGLSAAERRDTEEAFRQGKLHALVSTGTLELGLNMPSQSVVLADLSGYNNGKLVPLSTITAWQRAGRAGRRSGQPFADVHLLALPDDDARPYLDGQFPPLRSQLWQPHAALEFMLSAVDSGLTHTRIQATRLMAQTFAAHTENIDVQAALGQLILDGGVTETDGKLCVTPLGRVASQHMLPLAVVQRAELVLEQHTPFDVLLLLLSALEMPGIDVRFPRDQQVNYALENAIDAVLETVPSAVLDGQGHTFRASPLVKRGAALVRAACATTDEEVAHSAGVYPATIRGLREGAARVALAWCTYRPDCQTVRLLHCMLSAQVAYPQASLTLLHGVGGKQARKLAQAGIEDIEALSTLQGHEVSVPGVSAQRLKAWIEQAEGLVKTLEVDVTSEGTPANRDTGFGSLDWPADICPFRLRRAAFLHVETVSSGHRVTGGAEPHVVTAQGCDCLDASPLRPCKHQMAVKLRGGEGTLLRLVRHVLSEQELFFEGLEGGHAQT